MGHQIPMENMKNSTKKRETSWERIRIPNVFRTLCKNAWNTMGKRKSKLNLLKSKRSIRMKMHWTNLRLRKMAMSEEPTALQQLHRIPMTNIKHSTKKRKTSWERIRIPNVFRALCKNAWNTMGKRKSKLNLLKNKRSIRMKMHWANLRLRKMAMSEELTALQQLQRI